MKILFIGDIMGKIGRQAVAKILTKIKSKHKIDLVIANADNVAHGYGVTEKSLNELINAGVDFFTNGDHAFDKTKYLDCYEKMPIIRPANFSPQAPGQGYAVLNIKKKKVLIINLIGRTFMKKNFECPFHEVDNILANLSKKKLSAIIIDMHAETTSDKIVMGHYLDGRVSAVIGTHSHIMTADHKISQNKTAYITDVGMVGFADGSLGIEKEGIIKTYLSQIRSPHVIPEKGRAIFNSVLIEIDPKTKKAKKIKPITKFVKI